MAPRCSNLLAYFFPEPPEPLLDEYDCVVLPEGEVYDE